MTPPISIAVRPHAVPAFDADETPRDPRTGDVYHVAGGLAESRHVFLAGVGAPTLWHRRKTIAIGETGFGIGLNFLATWRAWQESRSDNDAQLDYVAIEGFPISREDLARAHAAFPELAKEAAALREAWPWPVGGIHRLWLDGGRVALTLVLADVEDGLAALSQPLDAWYLDGFAPARNPEMWTHAVFREVARLSRPGARLATFTAAGEVRHGLEAAGFEVDRVAGFGSKRHCLAARHRGAGRTPAAPGRPTTVAVVGAGVAGLAAARALRRRGAEVRVFDRAGPGTETSGIPAAMIAPRLQRTDSPRRTFNALAYLHALRFYGGIGDAWTCRGALALARDDDDAGAQTALAESLDWPAALMALCDADAASRRLGTPVPRGGLFHPLAGALDGRRLIDVLAAPLDVERASIAAIDATADGWRLLGGDCGEIAHAGNVVVAAGPWSAALLGDPAPPLRANRGQASVFEGGGMPEMGVTFGGYLAPAAGGRTVLGATFERLPGPDDTHDWRAARAADDAANLGKLAAHLPALAAGLGRPGGAWTGLRATTPDHLPHAGEVAPGLFVLAGMGARGFQAAPLLADLLADEFAGAPLAMPREVRAALDPARFAPRPSGR